MRWLPLLALAACWTAPIGPHDPTPRGPRKPPPKRVQCWSPEFHEQVPEEIDFYAVQAKATEWCNGWHAANPEHIDGCIDRETWREFRFAYYRDRYWLMRWFDACDPAKARP